MKINIQKYKSWLKNVLLKISVASAMLYIMETFDTRTAGLFLLFFIITAYMAALLSSRTYKVFSYAVSIALLTASLAVLRSEFCYLGIMTAGLILFYDLRQSCNSTPGTRNRTEALIFKEENPGEKQIHKKLDLNTQCCVYILLLGVYKIIETFFGLLYRSVFLNPQNTDMKIYYDIFYQNADISSYIEWAYTPVIL